MPVPSAGVARAALHGRPLLFLSAHLDDAVLSCGALIEALAHRCPVTVATVFTEAGAPPHTRAARSFLRACGVADASSLYADRQDEDRAVLDALGVRHVHLGVVDALFRPRDLSSRALRRAGRWVPELVHRYPTYRFDIAKGRVSRGDLGLIAQLTARVCDLLAETGAEVTFAPLGVGRHVDHLITRALAVESDESDESDDAVVFYSDFPYDMSAPVDQGFVERPSLEPWTWDEAIGRKARLIRGYRTQAAALFADGHIPQRPETYYERAIASA